MSWLRNTISRVTGLFDKNRVHAELEDELRAHIEMLTEEKIRQGMTPADARYAALRSFGGVEQAKQICREEWGLPMLEALGRDLRGGFRQLGRNRLFTVVAVTTLALGIGANAAIFSAVYAVLLKPLPFPNSGQLVRLFEANERAGIGGDGCSYQEFQEWQTQNRVFSGMAAVSAHELTLTGRGDPTVVRVGDVTSDFFSVLGVPPAAGRGFLPQDDVPGGEPVVVISDELWHSRFGADLAMIGSSIELDKRSFTVVGIMPAGFRFSFIDQGPTRQVWVPIVQDPFFGSMAKRPTIHLFTALARLRPGLSVEQGRADMEAVGSRLWKVYRPGDAGWAVRAATLREAMIEGTSTPLLMLLAAVGLVLLIACANVANLLLARATSRAREFALRAALGAGRNRILRQLLTESAVLGLAGAALGIGLAYWGVRGLSGLLPASFPSGDSIQVNGSVLAFALALSLTASLLFGVAHALFAADPRLYATLQESGGRPGEGKMRKRARNFLATAEIALAMVLLVGAGLLIRSFAVLLSVNPGFETQKILKLEVSLPRFQYKTPQQWTAFADDAMPRIQAQPDLQNTAVAVPAPLANQSVNLPFSIVNSPPIAQGRSVTADFEAISPNYFRVMSIPLLRGRAFGGQDSMSAPRVAIISKELARIYFPNQNPVGRQLVFGFPPDVNVKREIVGVVGDVRDASLSRAPGPMMYVPFDQSPFWGLVLVSKTSLSQSAATHEVEAAVHNVDRDLPVTDVVWMTEAVDASLSKARLRTWLFGLFGAMALTLAVAGIFGVISYSVSRRTHEFGIRIALGADKSEILGLVLKEALGLALAGVAIGVAASLGLARLISSLLYGVRATDPTTLIALPLVLTAAALLAAYIPAHRATKVDPLVALRHE